MKKTIFALSAAVTFIATAAYGQSLGDRLAQVQQQRSRVDARNASSKQHMLGVLLGTEVDVKFNETPARDAINYLKNVLGINILARYNDDRTGQGIDPDTAISIDLGPMPAVDLLEMLLAQCSEDAFDECTWQIRNGFVEVGTKERLSAKTAMEIRYYPINDLLFVVPYFNNAPEFNSSSALNQGGGGGNGGGGNGGGGGGGFGGGGGGGGGNGGGGNGGGGGGNIFSDPEDEDERLTETERAKQIEDVIKLMVEPDAWEVTAHITYYQGVFIVRAPDFVHRQIGGYPYAPRFVGTPGGGVNQIGTDPALYNGRFVKLNAVMEESEITGIRTLGPFGGAAGGGANP